MKYRITVNITPAEYRQLLEIKNQRNMLQADEGIHYSMSDILRIGLGYTYRKEIEEE